MERVIRLMSERYRKWNVDEVLEKYQQLRIRPAVEGCRLTGYVAFTVSIEHLEDLSDTYQVDIRVPNLFPKKLPKVWEMKQRIPKSFHTNPDGSLCLGSRTRQRLAMGRSSLILSFIEECLIPFLYGYTYYEKYNILPFGELDHGDKGILQDYKELFCVQNEKAAKHMVRLASMKRGEANKQTCPCGSEKRLGKCHNRIVNKLRMQLGRTWFSEEYNLIKAM